MPYNGTLNWNEICKALGEIDYIGDFTYEVSIPKFIGTMDDDFLPTALRYMADVGKHLVQKVNAYRP